MQRLAVFLCYLKRFLPQHKYFGIIKDPQIDQLFPRVTRGVANGARPSNLHNLV